MADLQRPHILAQRRGYGSLEAFLVLPEIAALGWPRDVVEQWLWDFIDLPEFLVDYADVDLAGLTWQLKQLPADEFLTMPTGSQTQDYLDRARDLHQHWTSVRSVEIQQAWEKWGLWLRAPIVLDRTALGDGLGGLQVVEGRTRVGIAGGRLREGLLVAPTLQIWLGRPAR